MKVKDPGHIFELDWLDVEPGYTAEDLHGYGCRDFVKREGEGYPGNVGHHEGTNIQEVLRALISRVKYLHAQVWDFNNTTILNELRHSLYLLEERAARRHGRSLSDTLLDSPVPIEEIPTCPKCGHIGCEGACHP